MSSLNNHFSPIIIGDYQEGMEHFAWLLGSPDGGIFQIDEDQQQMQPSHNCEHSPPTEAIDPNNDHWHTTDSDTSETQLTLQRQGLLNRREFDPDSISGELLSKKTPSANSKKKRKKNRDSNMLSALVNSHNNPRKEPNMTFSPSRKKRRLRKNSMRVKRSAKVADLELTDKNDRTYSSAKKHRKNASSFKRKVSDLNNASKTISEKRRKVATIEANLKLQKTVEEEAESESNEVVHEEQRTLSDYGFTTTFSKTKSEERKSKQQKKKTKQLSTFNDSDVKTDSHPPADFQNEQRESNNRMFAPLDEVKHSRSSVLSSFDSCARLGSNVLQTLFWNVTTIRKLGRIKEMEDFVTTIDPDILCLQEPRADGAIKINGYNEVAGSSNPTLNRMWVKKGIVYSSDTPDIKLFREAVSLLKDIAFSVICINKAFFIGVYVHPNKCATHELSHLLQSADRFFTKFALFGDLNGHCLSFGLMPHQLPNELGKAIDSFVKYSSDVCSYCSTEPTFQAGRYSSFLDGTLTNIPISSAPRSFRIFAGHRAQLIGFNHPITLNMDDEFFSENFKKDYYTDWAQFSKALMDDPPRFETPYEFFQRCVELMEECKIETEEDRRKFKPWWTSICKRAVINKRKWLRHRDNARSYQEYLDCDQKWKKAKANCNRVIEKAKQDFYTRVIKGNKDNPWKAIRIIQGRKKKRSHIFIDPDSAKTKCFKVAEDYRKVASDIPALSQQILSYINHLKESTHVLQLEAWELGYAIKSLKQHSSPGVDKVTTKLLLKLYSLIPAQLLIQLNDMCVHLEGPFKHSIIHPIPKAPPSQDSRPISLLSHSCKLIEKIVCARLQRNLQGSLFQNQFCRTGRGCEIALRSVFKAVRRMKDDAILLFLDVSKAYDRVSHSRLMTKLINCGASNDSVIWLAEWLQGRTWSVRIGTTFSSCYALTAGIPQGSFLSSLLWKVYIHDLHTNISEFLYMDDFLGLASTYSAMERACNKIESWASLNHVIFNPDKTRLMYSSSTEEEDSLLTLQGWVIPTCKSYKYLGIILSSPNNGEFNLQKQLDQDRIDLKRRITLLKNFKQFTGDNLRAIFHSIFISKMDYGLAIKAPIQDDLQVIQNQAIRELSDCRLHIDQLHEIWRIKPVKQRIEDRIWNIQTKQVLMNDSLKPRTLQTQHFEGRQYRIWNLASQEQLQASFDLARTCTTHGKWQATESIPPNCIQAFCHGAFNVSESRGAIGGLYFSNTQHEGKGAFKHPYRYVLSSYRVELLAMRQLLHNLHKVEDECDESDIFTDSLSLLQKLTSVYCSPTKPIDPAICDILQLCHNLKTFGLTVRIHWIPGHTGIIGNERADKLASEGMQGFNNLHVRNADVSSDAFKLRHHYSNPFDWKDFMNLSYPMRRIIIRVLTEQGNVRALTHHFDDTGTPLCRFCGLSRETVHHVLLSCSNSHSPFHQQAALCLLFSSNWGKIYRWCQQNKIVG